MTGAGWQLEAHVPRSCAAPEDAAPGLAADQTPTEVAQGGGAAEERAHTRAASLPQARPPSTSASSATIGPASVPSGSRLGL